jgi:hypothetical protein
VIPGAAQLVLTHVPVYILYFNRSLIEINSPLVRPTAGILETPAALSVLTSAVLNYLGSSKS